MPTLPSGLTIGIGHQAIPKSVGSDWFKCPEGHFWYKRPDISITPPPYDGTTEILEDWVHAPVPESIDEVKQYLYVLYRQPDGKFQWRGEWLIEFPQTGQLSKEERPVVGKRANVGAVVGTAANLLSDNGTNVNLYDVIVMGKGAWVGTALKGMFAVSPVLVRAKPSDSDVLAQRSKAGFKTMQSAVVTQPAHDSPVSNDGCGLKRSAVVRQLIDTNAGFTRQQ